MHPIVVKYRCDTIDINIVSCNSLLVKWSVPITVIYKEQNNLVSKISKRMFDHKQGYHGYRFVEYSQ